MNKDKITLAALANIETILVQMDGYLVTLNNHMSATYRQVPMYHGQWAPINAVREQVAQLHQMTLDNEQHLHRLNQEEKDEYGF